MHELSPAFITNFELFLRTENLPTNPLLADPMYWNGYIEKVGTGTEDIINKCREYGLKTPEFYQEEDFRVVIWRVNEEGDPKRSNDDPTTYQGVPEVCQSVPERARVYQSVPEQLMALIKVNPQPFE